ncbi:Uma2 family endonuclease, partial [Gemmatimonas sp.]
MAMPDTPLYRCPSPDRTVWTVADLEAIPDDGHRYEILHGELLVTSLSPTGPQRSAMRLTVLTVMWCRAHTGWTVLAPRSVHISETTWLEPDLALYAAQESADPSWREMPPPLLVVDVLSPSTRRRDRHRKRPTYLAHGVGELWLV